MVSFTGTATNPRTGTAVKWSAAQPVRDAVNQHEMFFSNTKRHKILGVLGDDRHLEGTGDHTPWSAGKKPGIVYACDLEMPPEFISWFKLIAPTSYYTLYIDYINFGGAQYNRAGQKVANSSDQHLHLSIENGHENTRITLIQDFYYAYHMRQLTQVGYFG